MKALLASPKPLLVGKSYQLRFIGCEGNVIAMGRDIVLWSTAERKRICSSHPFKHPGYMDVSPVDCRVVVKNTAGQLVILSPDSLDVMVAIPFERNSEGDRPMFSPCGKQIIDSSWDGVLRLLDSSSGKVVYEEMSSGAMIKSMTSDAGRRLFAYVKQPRVADRFSRLPFSRVVMRSWPFEAHQEAEIPVGDAYVDSISLSPDGRRLAMLQMNASAEFSLKVIDLSQGCAVACRGINPGGTNRSLAWSPDGSRLCCVEKDQLSVFDAVSLQYVARHVDTYPCYAEFSRDGTHVAIGSWQKGTILLTNQLEAFAGVAL